VGRRLQSVLRSMDTIARFDGDIFSIILPGAIHEGASSAARRVLEVLEPPILIEGVSLSIEASLGIAIYPEHGDQIDLLLQRAGVALHIAKETGSGYFLYATEADHHSPRRLTLMGQLRGAIERNELVLHYQPKIDLKSDCVTGVEALVRWRHPEFGMVPPVEFIAPAEQSGLIRPLTQWVLSQAVRDGQQLNSILPLSMAINLSRRNLHDPGLPSQVVEILKENGFPARLLVLELTESTVMADPVRSGETLSLLSSLGARLSIDDFGTGYSSLASLRRLPVLELKIDRSFTKEMSAHEGDQIIVRSTIELAHNMGLTVVAEGVEDRETLDHLVALGCDAAQGYFISRPLPFEEFTRWLQESPWGVKGATSREQPRPGG
jgi:diguanylate cyclase